MLKFIFTPQAIHNDKCVVCTIYAEILLSRNQRSITMLGVVQSNSLGDINTISAINEYSIEAILLLVIRARLFPASLQRNIKLTASLSRQQRDYVAY